MPRSRKPGAPASAQDPMPWAGADDPDYLRYMRTEWGVPVRRDRKLYEMLVLEAFQAGLTWALILKRRRALRHAFAGWDFRVVAEFNARDERRLLAAPGMIRNPRKIHAAVVNARALLEVRREHGTFSRYLWAFVDGAPLRPVRPRRDWSRIPATSDLAARVSRELKRRGFSFLGPVSCHAFLQAVGVIDDRPVKQDGRRKEKG